MWVEGVVGRFGKLDGAANCAGVIGRHHGTRGVEELEDGEWDLIMGVNLTGEFFSLLLSLPLFMFRGRWIMMFEFRRELAMLIVMVMVNELMKLTDRLRMDGWMNCSID